MINKNKSVFYLKIQFNYFIKNTNKYYKITSNNITIIIGYTLFALSEIIAVLPIPANGMFHSLLIGLKNSVSKINSTDIEMAQTLISTKPDMANIITTLQGNSKLIDSVKTVINNPEIITNVENIVKDKNLQFINTLLMNNPEIINDIKVIIIQKINDMVNVGQSAPKEVLQVRNFFHILYLIRRYFFENLPI